jgi:hypothetical protein
MDKHVHTAIVVAGLVFVILFGGMTLVVLAEDGLTILVVFSILIVGLLGVAIWGAINNPPDNRR